MVFNNHAFPYAFKNVGGNFVMGFPCDIFMVTVSHSRVIPSMDSSGNFVGMKEFLEVGLKIVHLVL